MGTFVRWIQKAMMSKKARCPEEEHWLELVRLMLDGQTTEEETSYVIDHVEGCYRCYDNYDLEKEIREAIKNKSINLKVSDALIARINNEIKA
ncbi:MAG: hypothetical protein L3J29_11085 [Cyclobacteriaceae bacterium]|nr:hypothetical protein [Cyclobacteriaceae bacterium]